MHRPIRERRIGLFAWLLGALVPLACLTAFFTFSKPVNLIGPWPLGIVNTEAAFYARWLDLRNDGAGTATAERYLFSSAFGHCPMDNRSAGGGMHWFEADGFGDSVRVQRSPSMPGAIVVNFGGEELFRAQREIVLEVVLLRRSHHHEEAARILGSVIKAKRNDFWVWAEAARLYSDDQPDLAIA